MLSHGAVRPSSDAPPVGPLMDVVAALRAFLADRSLGDAGATVVVDPKAVLFLLGTEMDFKTDKLASQFVFNNPNQTSACGCGESVQLEPAKLDPAHV